MNVALLWAQTLDGKVKYSAFGIIELKFRSEYSDSDPKDSFVSKILYLACNAETDTITISQHHAYYKHIEMHLSVTTQKWGYFLLFASTGMVGD